MTGIASDASSLIAEIRALVEAARRAVARRLANLLAIPQTPSAIPGVGSPFMVLRRTRRMA